MIKRAKWDFYACIGISIAAFLFVLYRIFSVSFTSDEFGMWEHSLCPGLEALITFRHQDPQSHFLQGLCAIPFLKYLPINTVIAIRLPSLCMFPIYVWAGMHLAKRFQSGLYRLFFFCTWLCPQIVLEYFGMARGYAFMLAFAGVAYAGLLEAFRADSTEIRRNRWTKVSILAAALAMLALLTFSYAYIMIAFLLLLRCYLEANGKFRNRILETLQRGSFVIWTSIVLGVFYLPRYLIIRRAPTMQGVIGGISNFVTDMFATMWCCIAYLKYTTFQSRALVHNITIGCCAFALCVLNLLVTGWSLHKRRVDIHSPSVLSMILFFGIAILSQFMLWMFAIQFPFYRTTLYLWPLFTMLIGFSTYENKWPVLRCINVLALLVVFARCIATYNTYTASESRHDVQNKEIAQVFCEMAQNRPDRNRPLFIAMSDAIRYTIWYYLDKEMPGMKVDPPFENNGFCKVFGNGALLMYSINYGYPQPFPPIWHHFPFPPDYYLLSPYEPGSIPNSKLLDMTPVRKFEKCDAALYKSKTPSDGKLGCDVRDCMICQWLYGLVGAQDAGKEPHEGLGSTQ